MSVSFGGTECSPYPSNRRVSLARFLVGLTRHILDQAEHDRHARSDPVIVRRPFGHRERPVVSTLFIVFFLPFSVRRSAFDVLSSLATSSGLLITLLLTLLKKSSINALRRHYERFASVCCVPMRAFPSIHLRTPTFSAESTYDLANPRPNLRTPRGCVPTCGGCRSGPGSR